MLSRRAVGWALLFSVPPGVGVTGFVTAVIGQNTVEPMAVLAGATTAVLLFALVLLAQATGSAQPAEVRERVD